MVIVCAGSVRMQRTCLAEAVGDGARVGHRGCSEPDESEGEGGELEMHGSRSGGDCVWVVLGRRGDGDVALQRVEGSSDLNL